MKQHGLVRLDQILPGIGFPEPVEKPKKPSAPRVINDPTRTPVNKQAALIIAKAPWLNKPLPPAGPPMGELEKLREEVARLRATNQNLVAENKALRRRIEKRSTTVKTEVSQPRPEPADTSKSEKLQILERLRNGSH